MKVLVLGASGATGRLVVQQLAAERQAVRIVVRDHTKIEKSILANPLVECITGNVSDFHQKQWTEVIRGCDAVISCLGHTISFSGIFGKPRMLVSDCLRSVCSAIESNADSRVKVILMNTTANRNRNNNEHYSAADRFVLGILTAVLPPQKDNVEAARFLADTIGERHPVISWCAVRPDTLIDEAVVTGYEVVPSPMHSPVFRAGQTSRINVSHFIVAMLLDEKLWETWKSGMPVIYNRNHTLPKK